MKPNATTSRGEDMSTATQHLLDAFDLLSAAEKQIVMFEILRRVQDLDLPPLSDEELVANAEELSLELDRREATDA
jgi:hypothetical protein